MSRFLNNNTDSFNTTVDNSVHVSNHPIVDNERAEILAWLSSLEPQVRHQDVRERREDNIGSWLLQSEGFKNWYMGSGVNESRNSTLFCYGNPGAGKTYISSLVIDTICDQEGGQGVSVACFYFDFAARNEQSATNMLGALLKQVVGGLKKIPDEITKAFKKQKEVIGGRGLRLPEIAKLLEDISTSQRMFICVDALDECLPVQRLKILSSLNGIVERSPGTRVFITGRPHVQAEVEKRLPGRAAFMSISPVRSDIIAFLRARLNEDTNPDAMDHRLEEELIEKIPETFSEVFLLVSLNIEAILRETTIHRRRRRLNAISDGVGLGDAYGATLDRITAQGGEKARLGMMALMWISHSRRPLQVNELCEALAVEIGETHLSPDNVPSLPTLLSSCQGLITVERETSTVRLIHFTLQEYLSTRQDIFEGAHSTIAETCLAYLNSQQVIDISASNRVDPTTMPFLEYSSIYWGAHAKIGFSSRTKSLALKLLGQCENHVSVRLLTKHELHRYWISGWERSSRFIDQPLHLASVFGIVELVATLIEMGGYDINGRDSLGATPLLWAARMGSEELVELLLVQEDINPDSPATLYGRTPLMWAARNGHDGVVKLLLACENVNPDKQDNHGQTALSLAASTGHDSVVKLLLACENVNPDKQEYGGSTPLSLAASNGHDGVVKLLLACENVNPDKQDNHGRTALSLAALTGHDSVVKLLLACENVNPDKQDYSGSTPLFLAALNGRDGVVKLLLACENVNPDKQNNGGSTPLSAAAFRGRDGVVKLLLACENVNPDKQDDDGWTPLSAAALHGHHGVMKLLLACENVNPDKQDNHGLTPLFRAARHGHDGVVKLLLACENVNPDKQEYGGWTPLFQAARHGHDGVVKLLLACGNVNPDKQDNHGLTPLFRAARHGHDGVVKLLLACENVNPNKQDKFGRTPLIWASRRGHHEVIKLLQPRTQLPLEKR